MTIFLWSIDINKNLMIAVRSSRIDHIILPRVLSNLNTQRIFLALILAYFDINYYLCVWLRTFNQSSILIIAVMKVFLLSSFLFLYNFVSLASVQIKDIFYNLSLEDSTAEVTHRPSFFYLGAIDIPSVVGYNGV